jgi:hypothetical protein
LSNFVIQCFFEEGALIPKEETDEWHFIAGEEDLSIEDAKTEQIGMASKIIIHPSYNPDYFTNDIAIVLLKEPFKYNYYVQPLSIGKPAIQAIAGGGSLYIIKFTVKFTVLKTDSG